jgi:biofilm protein TabA
MIFDRIENARFYRILGPRFAKAFDWLKKTDVGAIPIGRYEIEGGDVFALVQEYDTKAPEAGKWEAHRKFADVQFLVEGAEYIGFAHLSRMVPGEYDSVKDFLPLSGKCDFDVNLSPGDYAILFPYDAHQPCMSHEPSKPSKVKKIVLKVRVAD